jgi:uncharacterized membrane protein YccC
VADADALKAAARAAIVMPSAFAFAHVVIGNPQTSLFAAFGSFALLLFVEFGGRPRARLVAYLVFAAGGALLISVGTICSRNAWLAAGAMAVTGFAIVFAGAFSSYLAAARNGAILLFLVPASVPAPNSALDDRLLGWALAAGLGTAAMLVLWPPRRRAELRIAAAGAMRAVVALLESEPDRRGEREEAARAAVATLWRGFLGSQHRPTGPTAATAALAALPDELDWLLSFLVATPEQPALEVTSAEATEALGAAAAVLRASIDRLEGGSAQADFDRLDRAQYELARALLRRLPELPADALPAVLEAPFRVRAATYAARQLAIYSMRATAGRVTDADGGDAAASAPSPVDAAQRLALEHADPRSVWLQNSIRAAVALGLAVLVAQLADVQHGFWIVLGTLSVLRSNALGTGWSVVSALAGTAAGIVVGALLVIAIGTHHAVLWIVLPPAVLLAAYAPRAISFAAGQAGFTVVLVILFNLIQPVGWRVGLVRVEDVAIGFAVSLVVGLVFWPRGAAAQLRADLASAFARGADSVVAAVHEVLQRGDRGETDRAGLATDAALHRLDDAFRQHLDESSATSAGAEDVAALVNAAVRVRRVARSLRLLADMTEGRIRLDRCSDTLEPELAAIHAWYVSLGDALESHRELPPPTVVHADDRRALLDCVRVAAGSEDTASRHAALSLVVTAQYLENLHRLEARIGTRARAARTDSPRFGIRLRARLAP